MTNTSSTLLGTKKVGALRAGFIGFFVGALATSAFAFSYILQQHTAANRVVVEQVLELNERVPALADRVLVLENGVKRLEKEKGKK